MSRGSATTARTIGVLDVGKTNVKLLLHDIESGRDVAARSMPNRVLQDGPYPHFDIAALQAFVLDGLADFIRGETVPLDALVVTAHGASGAVIGPEELALPVLDYEYAGPDALAEAYDAIRPDFAETCSPRLPAGLNLGAQLYWQSRMFPKDFGRAHAIVTYPQFWAWWLSGVAATEATSLGAHTDLWNPAQGRLSSLPGRAGFADKLAPLRRAWEVLGVVRPSIAARLGLDRPVPVLTGIHDSNAALLPYRLAGGDPMSVVSTGTWAIIFGLGGSPVGLDPARDTLANVDLFGTPVPSARFMAGREFDLIAGPGDHPEPDAATVGRLIAAQIMVLPTLVPGSGPFPRATSGWWPDGADERLSPAERVAVASLYAGLVTATCLDLLGLQGPTVVEGPFSRNALYLDALLALTGRPVLLPAGPGGSAAGAARLAAMAMRPVAVTTAHRPQFGLDQAFRLYAHAWASKAQAKP